MSQGARELAAHVALHRPGAAVAILGVTFDSKLGTHRLALKGYNTQLKDLVDIAEIASPDVSKVFLHSPVFLNRESAAIFAASIQRYYEILSAFLEERAVFATTLGLLISWTGRMKRITKEFRVTQRSPGYLEYVITEQQMPEDVAFTVDLQTPYHIGRVPTKRRSPVDSPPGTPPGVLQLGWIIEQEFAKRVSAADRDFKCSSCGANETSQRRCEWSG